MNARKRRYACINEKTCVACGECEYVCPRGAAKVMNGTTAVVGFIAVRGPLFIAVRGPYHTRSRSSCPGCTLQLSHGPHQQQ